MFLSFFFFSAESNLVVPDDDEFYKKFLRPCKWYPKSSFELVSKVFFFFFFEYKCNRCCKNRFDFTDEKILQIQIEQSSLLPRSRAQQRAKSATLRYRDTVTGSNGGRLQNDFNQRRETMESKNNKRRWNTSNDDAVDRDGYIRAENAGTLAKILQERGDRFSIFSLQCF